MGGWVDWVWRVARVDYGGCVFIKPVCVAGDATAASPSEQKPLCCCGVWDWERSSVSQADLHKKEGSLKGCAVQLKCAWERGWGRHTVQGFCFCVVECRGFCLCCWHFGLWEIEEDGIPLFSVLCCRVIFQHVCTCLWLCFCMSNNACESMQPRNVLLIFLTTLIPSFMHAHSMRGLTHVHTETDSLSCAMTWPIIATGYFIILH